MYPIHRILVGLDFTDMDEQLIKYAMFVARHSEVDHVYFVHTIRDVSIPKDILEKYPDISGPVDEDLIKRMKKKVKPLIDPDFKGKIKYDIKEGSAFNAFTKMVKVKHIDLIVVGRKKTSVGMGVLPGRLGRSATCALLIVPEDATPEIKKILVPLDETHQSEYALNRALLLAENIKPAPTVITQSIYNVPEGYHKTGKSYYQFARIMKDHAVEYRNALIKKIDERNIKIIEKYTLDHDFHPVPDILKVAQQQKADVIIIGAKAVTTARALIKRSVAEKLIRADDNFPLLIVRHKKKVGVIESVKNK